MWLFFESKKKFSSKYTKVIINTLHEISIFKKFYKKWKKLLFLEFCVKYEAQINVSWWLMINLLLLLGTSTNVENIATTKQKMINCSWIDASTSCDCRNTRVVEMKTSETCTLFNYQNGSKDDFYIIDIWNNAFFQVNIFCC